MVIDFYREIIISIFLDFRILTLKKFIQKKCQVSLDKKSLQEWKIKIKKTNLMPEFERFFESQYKHQEKSEKNINPNLLLKKKSLKINKKFKKEYELIILEYE